MNAKNMLQISLDDTLVNIKNEMEEQQSLSKWNLRIISDSIDLLTDKEIEKESAEYNQLEYMYQILIRSKQLEKRSHLSLLK